MGVTIHFRGKIDNLDKVENLTAALKDLGKRKGWEYHEWNKTGKIIAEGEELTKLHLRQERIAQRGVVLFPHKKVESLSVVVEFPTGKLIQMFPGPGETLIGRDTCFIKTQFAPVEVHIEVCEVLGWLKENYCSNLEVIDEGRYWETGDRRLLEENMAILHGLMDELEGGLKGKQVSPYMEELVDAIQGDLKLLRKIEEESKKSRRRKIH